ncbi:MAG TPA: hypothetical protein DEF13_03600 [Holosporales bacterium]|nr:hypothetical protein [Holosporales bacterium]
MVSYISVERRMSMRFLKTKLLPCFILLVLQTIGFAVPSDWPKDGIIVEPDMGRTPLLTAFDDAKSSLYVSAYKLTDKRLIEGLGNAAKRGVNVNVLVTRSIYTRLEETNPDETPIKRLQKMGIIVNISPEFFAQTHYKLVIIDGTYALIGTGNMCDEGSFDDFGDRAAERDFWTTVTDKEKVDELVTVFLADFTGKPIKIKESSYFVWNPDHGRAPILKFIRSAKCNLWIYQQDIQDRVIASAIADAARRKIDVRLIMSPFPFSPKKDNNIPHQNMIREAGGKVGMSTKWTIHAKTMLADVGTPDAKALLGSANFYPNSLEHNREVGMIISNPEAIKTMKTTFEEDWKMADFTPRKEEEELH